MPSSLPWIDPAGPIPVEYSLEAVEKIRRLAYDGLLSLPRVGLGVGGFLLGTRQGRKIAILDFHPIDCSHSAGPSFLPTRTEIAEAKSALNGSSRTIVGFYCSRPRRDLKLTDKDRALFDGVCPGPGQVALIIRPSAMELTRAVLYYRSADGTWVEGAERALEEIELAQEPEPAPEPKLANPEIARPQVAKPEIAGPQVAKPQVAKPQVAKPELAKPDLAKPEVVAPKSVELPTPPTPRAVKAEIPMPTQAPPPPVPVMTPRPQLFGDPEPLPLPAFASVAPPRTFPWQVVAAAALTAAILIAAFLTAERWMPRPALELRTAETNGHFFIEWNRAAVRGIDRGLLTVTDGKSLKQIPLSAAQLEAGTIEYPRETKQVTAVLDAGDARASANFTPPVIPETPPGDLPPQPPGAAPPETSHP